jgi:hypothetical protein
MHDDSLSPPQFQAAVVFGKSFRFQSNAAAVATSFTAINLLDLFAVAVSATASNRLCSGVKLRRIRVWGPPASTLVPVTVSIEYNSDPASGFGAPDKLKSDTSMGADRCAYVSYRPPQGCVAAMWQGPAAVTRLFQLSCPLNSIVEVDLTMVMQNGETPVATAAIVAGATIGTVFVRGLDGLIAGTTVFPPLSYTTL